MKKFLCTRASIFATLALPMATIATEQTEVTDAQSEHAAHRGPTHGGIQLEARALALADGVIVTADAIDLIRGYQKELLKILIGELQPDGTRTGRYRIGKECLTVRQLAKKEREMSSIKQNMSSAEYELLEQEMYENLVRTKTDFIAVSVQFRDALTGPKEGMRVLVEESCKKRNRSSSILIEWAKSSEEEEQQILEEHIHDFRSFEEFSVDLFNFLNDVVHSCPKARAQFEQRIKKFNTIKDLFTSIASTMSDTTIAQRRSLFLGYVKPQLDDIALSSITGDMVRNLINTWLKEQRQPA